MRFSNKCKNVNNKIMVKHANHNVYGGCHIVVAEKLSDDEKKIVFERQSDSRNISV